ncbi:MAG: glycoside hydrolase family 3 C-terminal domain-containing protein [Clostridia bacterium]|nr:glycoside hydrolase family 3 C-terminal domain-containing protein [Clostridia bacterium]
MEPYMHSELACEIEEEGIVLLKNEGMLPLKTSDRIFVIGERSRYPFLGGGGSSEVYVEDWIDIFVGLKEESENGAFVLLNENDNFSAWERKIPDLTENDIAVYTISVFSTEGEDIKPEAFGLSEKDREILNALSKSAVGKVIVVLNTPSFFKVSELNAYEKVKAVAVTYYGGMYIGRALARVLTGKVCPSGRLPDTWAVDEKAYPSDEGFYETTDIRYSEGVYVGYRYFESEEAAKEKVLYPFGFGLSYTRFSFSVEGAVYSEKTDEIRLSVSVKNIGERAGKEVVQIYFSSPCTEPLSPSVELVGFFKTRELMAGETEEKEYAFPVSAMRSFDEKCGAFVLKEGEYTVLVGTNAREAKEVFTWKNEKKRIIKKVATEESPVADYPYIEDGKAYKLSDVDEGKISLREFVCRMSDRELVDFCQAQPPAYASGTAGYGNSKKYGVPNVQTADGPAGVRRSVSSTYFPCATAVAATWNVALAERMGEAVAEEATALKTDIMLAPGVNIHRHPLCGRNFEYFSEDPLLAGKMGAAYINGVQSKGIGACVKHFVTNNKEDNRHFSNSIVSERALREIYYRVFEIVLENSAPLYLMSSYNLLNGNRCAKNREILRKVLREDFSYRGTVLTDWEIRESNLYEELIAGGNIKNPQGHPEQLSLCEEKLKEGCISRNVLAESVEYILGSIMRLDVFKRRYMGETFPIGEKGYIDAINPTFVTSTWARIRKCSVGCGRSLHNLKRDARNNLSCVGYDLIVEKAGRYRFDILLAAASEQATLEISVDGVKQSVLTIGKIPVEAGQNPQDVFFVRSVVLELPQGESRMELLISDLEKNYGIDLCRLSYQRV